MKLRDACKKLGIRSDGLDYAAGRLSINTAEDITRGDMDRIYAFLKVHSSFSPAIMKALEELNIDDDDGAYFLEQVRNAQQTDRSDIVYINVSTGGFEYRLPGIKYFKVTNRGDGRYQLDGQENWSIEYCEAVYWLPYVGGRVTSTNRATYEYDENVDFFMTMELSGCRFTITDQSVYHVAYDAGSSGHGGDSSQGTRNAAESRAMNVNLDDGINGRRLSISGDDLSSYGYGFFESDKCRATIIGVRRGYNQEWVYKAFIYHSLAYIPNSQHKSFVQVLDNTKYKNDSYWSEEFQ